MGSVLVVDDDADGREAVARFLRRAGLAVEGAGSGRDALVSLVMRVPDVIVLDLRMPGMDGLAFLDVIRNYMRWSHVPVIMVTAYPDEVPMDRLHKLRVKMTYVKSTYRLEDLLACVRKLIDDPESRCDALGSVSA